MENPTPEPTGMDRLADATEALVDKVDDLAEAHRISKTRMRILAASVVFDILLSVILGVVAWRADTAIKEAQQSSSAAVVNCEAQNAQGVRTKALWSYAFGLSPESERTSIEQERINNFQAYLDRTFTQKDCSKLRK